MSKFVVSAAAFFWPILVAMLLTGDVLGFRLTLIKSSEGYAAKLLSIQGEPPGSTADGTATVSGSALTVDLMEGTRPVSFKGRITAEEITGRFVFANGITSGGSDLHWTRVAANEMSLGACGTRR